MINNDTPIIYITQNVKIDASNPGRRLQVQASNSNHDLFQVVGENASLELVRFNLFGANGIVDGTVILAQDGAKVKVVDCTFASNRTSQHGAVIALFDGSSLTVENCDFTGNIAPLGGGAFHLGGRVDSRNCRFYRRKEHPERSLRPADGDSRRSERPE